MTLGARPCVQQAMFIDRLQLECLIATIKRLAQINTFDHPTCHSYSHPWEGFLQVFRVFVEDIPSRVYAHMAHGIIRHRRYSNRAREASSQFITKGVGLENGKVVGRDLRPRLRVENGLLLEMSVQNHGAVEGHGNGAGDTTLA